MKNTKSKTSSSPGALILRYLPPVLIAVTIGLLLTTALAHLSARQADERNRKIVEAGLQFHLALQRLTATLDPEYDPARADFAALAQASKKFSASLESMQRDLVLGTNADSLPRRLRDAIQRITEKQRAVDAVTAQAEKLGSVRKTLEGASDNFGSLITETQRQAEGYDALARGVSQLNPKSLPQSQALSLGAAFLAADGALRAAVEKLRTEPANAQLQADARAALKPVVTAAKAIAQKYGEFPSTKDAQALNRQFAAVAEAAERSAGEGVNAAPVAPDVDHAKIRAELRRARTELLTIGQQLPVVNEYFERFLDRPPVASLAELLFLVGGGFALISLGFAWRSAAVTPVAPEPQPAARALAVEAREPARGAQPLAPLAPLGAFESEAASASKDPFGSDPFTAGPFNSDPFAKDSFSADPFAGDPFAGDGFEKAAESNSSASADAALEPAAQTVWSTPVETPAGWGSGAAPGDDSAATTEAKALRELLTDVDRRLGDIASRAEEDSRHVEELLSALGQSWQVVEQAARIQTEMSDAAQSLQSRAAEMRDTLPAQGAMVRQVREALINYAAASSPSQSAGEILYSLLDRLQVMEKTADLVDVQLHVGIERLAKLPEGFGSLRTKATTLLEGARQLEHAHDEALIVVGGWRDEIVAIRTRLVEAVHA
jgi:hypothetical protein